MRTTNIKFSGMASGLDTDAMVKALTMPYKQKVDTAKQDQLLMELKKDKWKEVNTKVQGFYTNYLSKMRLGGTFLNEKTNVSNPNLIDITGKFSDGAHELEIVSLAKKAMLETAQVTDKNVDIKTLTYPIELKIDGEVVSLDQGDLKTTDATFEDLAKRMQEKIQNSPNLTEEQ
ncbi:MAG: flagellar cap protein FliD N-terminal domain-containing protein, partial [Cellulosilyticaceae bacterium]